MEEENAELKEFAFRCMKCDKQYLHNANLLKHIRLKHQEDTKHLIARQKLVCGECRAEFMSKLEFERHLETAHGIVPSIEVHEFATLEECMTFKANVELRTNSRFVKRSAQCGKNTTTFYCNRGGHHRPNSRGLRPNRAQPSLKVNCFCPAQVKVVSLESRFKVVYCSTHVGHSGDKSSFLSVDEVSSVAEKLAKNVSMGTVFDDIKDSLLGEADRNGICCQRDVDAINSQYRALSLDVSTFDLWLEDLVALQPSPVLLCKKKGEVCGEFPQLERGDFVLVLMTEFQADMLARHGKELVSVGHYPGSNERGAHLVALTVCDRRREGCPVCFVLVNRVNSATLVAALTAVRRKCPVKPAVVLTDDEELLFESWCRVFGEQKRRMLNPWDVDRRLRAKITQLVAQREDQANVYKLVRTLMEEAAAAAFQRRMRNACDVFAEDARLKQFGEYFTEAYARRSELWSSAYRRRNNIRRMEKVHRTLEHVFSGGEMARRLDGAVPCLLWYVREKFLERFRCKSQVPPALCDAKNHHQAGVEISPREVFRSGRSWVVNSTRLGETFTVTRMPFCREACPFQCKECSACVHEYICSCSDSVIFHSMCPHIHAVCWKVRNEGDEADMTEEADFGAEQEERTEDSLRQEVLQLCGDLQQSVEVYQRVATADELRSLRDVLSRTLSTVNSYREVNMAGRSCEEELAASSFIQTSGVDPSHALTLEEAPPENPQGVAYWLSICPE